MTTLRGAGVVAAVALLLTGGLGEAGPKRGGTLRAVFGADPPTLDPAQSTDTTSSAVIRQLFDGLLELDEQLRVRGALAASWTVSPDRRVYTFKLRTGVKFHHGRELDSADVAYSFERAARGKRPWVFEKIAGAQAFIQGKAAHIEGLRAADRSSFEIRLERPFAPFLYLMAYDAASIVARDEVERRGAAFSSSPVGTGAFKLGTWRHDDQVVLEAFPDHFRGAPWLDRIVFRIIPAEITRFYEYRAGHLDVTDIPTGHCRAVQKDPAFKGHVAIWSTLGTHAVRFNVERPPFDNSKVRRAIAHAVDPSIIVGRVLENCVTPARGVLPPAMPGYSEGVSRLGVDLPLARRLLAEAGFPDGKGMPRITYHFNTNDLNQRIAEVLQAQLKQIGIALELRRLDWAAHIKLVDDGEAGFFRQGWIADYPDPENFLTVLFHTRNVGAAGNTSRYRNPAVDRLFDTADTLTAGSERFRPYREAEQILLDDAVWISLYHYTSRALIQPSVKGLERSALSSAPELLAPLRNVWLDR